MTIADRALEKVLAKINPEARSIVLDTSDAPDVFHLVTFNAKGDLLDLLQDYSDLGEAHTAAEKLAHASKLPLVLRETPYG